MVIKSKNNYQHKLDFISICCISSFFISNYILPISALASQQHQSFIIAKPPDEREPEAVQQGIEQIPTSVPPASGKPTVPIESPIPATSPQPVNTEPTPTPAPTPTSTPRPVNTEPTPAPTPTPRPVNTEPTPAPTPTPRPVNTEPTPAPTSTPRPVNTQPTPAPTPTPRPVNTEPTPAPTSTPRPVNTQPTPAPTPTPEPVNTQNRRTPTPEPVNTQNRRTPTPEPVNTQNRRTPTPEPVNTQNRRTPTPEPVNTQNRRTPTPRPSNTEITPAPTSTPRPSRPIYYNPTPQPSNPRVPNRQGGSKPNNNRGLESSPFSSSRKLNYRQINFVDIAFGVLAPGDLKSQGRYFHFYQFQGRANQLIQIRLGGSTDKRRSNNLSLDPFMFVLDPNNKVLLKRGSGEKTSEIKDAFVFVRLPANGTYTIAVTSKNPGDTGRYSLAMRNDRASYSLDDESELSPQSLRKQNGSVYDISKFQGKKDQLVSVRVDSVFEEFSPYIVLLDSQGKIVAADNANDGRYSALIDRARLPRDETYYVVVISGSSTQRGKYRLTIF